MDDKLQPYRQPLVTATGIILGFVLNFASSWVKADSLLNDELAYFVGGCVLSGIVCLIVTLYRILRITYPKDRIAEYYNTTLQFFIAGVSLAFIGAMVDMFANFMN